MTSPAVLGGRCRARGDFAGAEPLVREALAIAESARPRDEQALALPRLLPADRAALAAILDGVERYDEAERLYRRAIAEFEREPMDPLEPGHPRLVACAGTAWGGAA